MDLLAAPPGFAIAAVILWALPRASHMRLGASRLPLALAAAAVASLAPAAPADLAGIDGVLRGGYAGVAAFFASRCPSPVVAVASVVAVAAAWDSPALPFAAGVAGAAIAAAATSLRPTVVSGACAAALAPIGMHLEHPSATGGTALAAAAVVLPLVVLGVWRSRPRANAQSPDGRHRLDPLVLRVVAVAILAAGAVSVVAGVASAIARPRLERGVAASGDALIAVRAADSAKASRKLDVAEQAFDDAKAFVDGWWMTPARAVPIVGQHVRAVRQVSVTGRDLARSGAQVAIAGRLDDVTIVDGQVPLDRFAAIERPLGHAVVSLDAATGAISQLHSPWLLPSFDRRLDREHARLERAHSSAKHTRDVIAVLPDMLGANGDRRYFLLLQTPSEMRGTGGFMGSYGEITATNGRVDLGNLGRAVDLNTAGDVNRTLGGPEDYVARYARFEPALTWQNVTMSPDFPSVAEVVADLYPKSGGRPVDGVIALDPAGIAALLRVTGPVTVEGWPTPINAGNAERVLLHEQYVRFPDSTARADFVGATASELWRKLTSGRLPSPPKLLSALGPAVAKKHLLVSSTVRGAPEALAAAGVDGAIAPVGPGDDFLGVVTQNAGGNKIDWFLRRVVDYDVTVDRDTGALTANVQIRLLNEAPDSGLPEVVIGSALRPPPPSGTNRAYVSVYTPWSLGGAQLDGQRLSMESEFERGRRVYSTYVEVPPRSSVLLTLRLEGVFDVGASDGGAALVLHRQPLVAPDEVDVRLSWAGGASVERSFKLEREVRVAWPR